MQKSRNSRCLRTLIFTLVDVAVCAVWLLVSARVLLETTAPLPWNDWKPLLLALASAVCFLPVRLVFTFFLRQIAFGKSLRSIREKVHALQYVDQPDAPELPRVQWPSARLEAVNEVLEQYQNLLKHKYQIIRLKNQAEYDALQSQINPHLLYNTLDSIRGIAITQGSYEIEIMTKALSDLFRYSIDKKGNNVHLQDELGNIRNYFMIQRFRFHNRFSLVEEIEPDTLACYIPKLIVQPLIENALYHGLEPKYGRGTITVRAERTQSRLLITVRDDGIGIEEAQLRSLNRAFVEGLATSASARSRGTKIGLANVNQRIRYLYGEQYGVRIYGSPHVGTTAELTLPALLEP